MSRLTLLPIVCILLTTAAHAWSQSCTEYPGEPGATLLGSFAAVADLADDADAGTDLYLPSGSYRTQFEVCVWSTSTGEIRYVINVASIGFGGNTASDIDQISTVSIFRAIAHAAVRHGVNAGYGRPWAPCSGGDTITVYMRSCVHRSGSGGSTSFAICGDPVWSRRSFLLCTPAGAEPTITPIAPAVPDPSGFCPAGCESSSEQ